MYVIELRLWKIETILLDSGIEEIGKYYIIWK